MPDDNFRFPRRLIGYGAYNLCFDKQLGKLGDNNFFEGIRARLDLHMINLVRVICFRRATQEGLPNPVYDVNGVPTGRTQTLFTRNRDLNPGFLDNLLRLVNVAKANNFWVQVCIFHYHAIAQNSRGSFEDPENVPALLDPHQLGNVNCDRLTKFFNINESTQQGRNRFALQKDIVRQIADKLKNATNVLFEIGNELRIQGCAAEDNELRNCAMAAWLEAMRETVRSVLPWDHEPSGTSTGATNEHHIFDKDRPAGCSATSAPYRPFFFDFHSGQWGLLQSINSNDYEDKIPAALKRVNAYRQKLAPGARLAAPLLIINDDGVKFDEPTDVEKRENAARIKRWAKVAFQNGLHYASKQQYGPEPYDTFALNALRDANDEVPI